MGYRPTFFEKADLGKVNYLFAFSSLFIAEPIRANPEYLKYCRSNDGSRTWWNSYFFLAFLLKFLMKVWIFPELLAIDWIAREFCIAFFCLTCGRTMFTVCSIKSTYDFSLIWMTDKTRNRNRMLPRSPGKRRGTFTKPSFYISIDTSCIKRVLLLLFCFFEKSFIWTYIYRL